MKWKPLKCGLAMMLAAVLALPIMPARAEDELSAEKIAELEASVVVPEGEPVTLDDLARNLEISPDEVSSGGVSSDGISSEGISSGGNSSDGISSDGISSDGISSGGNSSDGISPDGISPEEVACTNDMIVFNTGNGNVTVAQGSVSGGDYADAYFEEDGSFTIPTELNAFFPYEVQFTCNGEVSRQWFMTPDSSVEVGGHTFYVNTAADGTMVTQMSLEVGGDTVVVYPEEKEFPEGAGIMPFSLLPIKEVSLGSVDLTGYTPVELTQVSVKALLGANVADGDMVVWKQMYDSQDEYTVSQSGDKINLSVETYYSSSQTWEMIVGSGDQLDADAVRYRLPIDITASRNWLVPTVYMQNEQGVRTSLSTVENDTYYRDYEKDDREMRIYAATSEVGTVNSAYVSLGVNPNEFAGNHHLRAFEGSHASAAEAMAAAEITDRIFCGDMTQANAGYLLQRYTDSWITVVSYDDSGNVTGCLPFYLYLNTRGYSLSWYGLAMKNANGNLTTGLVQDTNSHYADGCSYRTYTLYKGYAANGTYYQRFAFSKDGVDSPESVAGAYLGLYNSLAEAAAAGAVDIKADLFGREGYATDYSNGIYVTIIVGADGSPEQMIWKYCIQTEEGTVSSGTGSVLGSGSQVNFYQFKTEDGTYVPCYQVSSNDDSYGEYNFLTVLVGKDVTDAQLSHLAPEFSVSNGAKLYAAGSSTEEISGESFHDFTSTVQYTVSAENGENAKNYWVQVVRAADGAGQLYVNSLADADAETQVKDGVIYSTREVMLDGYHYNVHDILFANMGTEAVKKLSVELVSDTVQLNDYWTLKGEEDLLGFVDTTGYQPGAGGSQGSYSSYGELWNLAKVRLTAKQGVAAGTDVSGTLTVKSEGTTLMVLTLTGTVGNPSITTTEIPEAVRYVPYGTMIQNSNKYSWNQVSYELYDGSLPAGMIVKPNGELYGVPTEAGTFTFTVEMTNSYGPFGSSTKTYTMTVKENTDANVDAATDSGYDLTQRVQYAYDTSAGDQLMVSQGVYGEFVDLYLDGVKLTDGVDYTSESGSTRITIYSQTLTNNLAEGTHTLGIEFRDQADTLKRAAQNYVIGDIPSSDEPNGSDDDNGDNGGDGSSGGSAGSTAAQGGTAADAPAKYTVVKGDTLSRIAKKHGISLSQLLAWNPQIKNPNLIYPGQIIAVGVIQGAGVAAIPVDGAVYDIVKTGDCLYKIAGRNGITLGAVMEMNPEIAKQKYIYAGQKIRVK